MVNSYVILNNALKEDTQNAKNRFCFSKHKSDRTIAFAPLANVPFPDT